MRHRMALIGGDRRQTTNGRFDQNIIPEHFPAHAPPAHRTRFPRLARALNFDLERAPKKKCTQLTPPYRRFILLAFSSNVRAWGK